MESKMLNPRNPRSRHARAAAIDSRRAKEASKSAALARVLNALDGYHYGRVSRDTVSMTIRVASTCGWSNKAIAESCGISIDRVIEAKRGR